MEAELLQDGDSDDEQFEGFTVEEEVAESERRHIKKDEETARIIHETGGWNALYADLSSDLDLRLSMDFS